MATKKELFNVKGVEMTAHEKMVFDKFVEQLSRVFDEADLRAAFQDVLEQVDQAITDGV